MDRASHLFGKCSECDEIICVEKAVAEKQNTQQETDEMIYKAFRTHVKLKYSEDASQAARQAETKKMLDDYKKKSGQLAKEAVADSAVGVNTPAHRRHVAVQGECLGICESSAPGCIDSSPGVEWPWRLP
jgi:alpha-acetolactate decarboxylase